MWLNSHDPKWLSFKRPLTASDGRTNNAIQRRQIIRVVPPNLRNLIAEGWTISNNHAINQSDPSVLYKGDGDKINALGTDYKYKKIDSINLIENVAGNRTDGYSGDGGPADQAQLANPKGITVDAAGNIYIADLFNSRVRKVDKNGIITTVAGNGAMGFNGDGIPATSASLLGPVDVTVDDLGNIYIVDSDLEMGTGIGMIRKVDKNGIITTVAGSNSHFGPDIGDGLPANSPFVLLANPHGVAVDTYSNIYIADTDNHRIRLVDPNGIITTIAGNGIPGYTGDGGPAGMALLNHPQILHLMLPVICTLLTRGITAYEK